MIRAGDAIPDGLTARTDVCIIGSGAAGGLAAGMLAEAGRDVIVLEEGPHVPRSMMTQREEQMHPLLYRDGGAQLTADGGVNVLQGRCVGGSTVINMADCVAIPDGVLDHWRAHFGVDRYSTERVHDAARAAEAAIGANLIDEATINANNRLLLEGGRALGHTGGTFVHNRVQCLGSGYCLLGCAYDAKQSVAVTWIPRALATGRALVQTDARVLHLEHDSKRVVAAVGQIQRRRDGARTAPLRVEAEHFILAAGAVHSPLILLASELGGKQVGRNLSLQPQAPIGAQFTDDVIMWRGVPQASYIDSTEHATEADGLSGFRLEAVSVGPAMAAVSIGLGGDAVHDFMRSFKKGASCLCLVPDRPVGRVTAKGGRPRIDYPLTSEVQATLKQALGTAARSYLRAGADQVLLPFPDAPPIRSEADLAGLDTYVVQPASLTIISAHPQGTCRMGPDPGRSVVGLDGFVHGVPNLQVLDASVFPTTASSHTMIPVMTMATLGVGELLG